MNQKYDVVWSYIAEKDLKNIVEYIADDSPPDALTIIKRINQNASSLYIFPERGQIVPELRDQGILQYRELVIIRGESYTEFLKRVPWYYQFWMHAEISKISY